MGTGLWAGSRNGKGIKVVKAYCSKMKAAACSTLRSSEAFIIQALGLQVKIIVMIREDHLFFRHDRSLNSLSHPQLRRPH